MLYNYDLNPKKLLFIFIALILSLNVAHAQWFYNQGCGHHLSVACSGTDGSCWNNKVASASVYASGGYTPYHYLWSNGATTSSISNLAAGTYSVTVTDCYGNSGTCAVTVSVVQCCNVTCSGTISGNETHCGSYTASTISSVTSASGGVGPVEYQWQMSFDNFSSYTVIIGATGSSYSPGIISQTTYFRRAAKNSGCTDYSSVSNIVVKTVNALPQVTCTSVNGDCTNGLEGSASVAVTSGMTPYHYSWSNGATTSAISNLGAGMYSVTVTDANSCSASCSSNVSVQQCCNVTDAGSISGNEAYCGSYSASLINNVTPASGGIGTPQYQWQMSLDNFSTFTIIDGATDDSYSPGTISQTTYFRRLAKNSGCSDYLSVSNTVVKTVNGIPEVTCSSVNGDCSNGLQGSASVSVTGGTPDYSYSWSNGGTASSIANLTAGTYSVTVIDGNGCSASCSSDVTVQQCCNVTDAGSISGDEAHCGSYVASSIDNVTPASGGVGTPQYEWQMSYDNFSTFTIIDGATDDSYSPGTISQTTYFRRLAKNSGCSDYVAVTNVIVKTVYESPAASCTPTSGDCHSNYLGNICVTVNGGTEPYTYLWSNGGSEICIYDLDNGDYTVTVTDNHQCVSTCTSTISNSTPVNVDETHVDVSVNGGNDGSIDITVTGGVGPYTYLWNDGSTDEDRTGLSAGTYSLVVTDYNGCTGGVDVLINQPTCHCQPPANVVVTPTGNDQLQVCWDAQDCATGYILQYQWKGHTNWNTVNITSPDHCGIFDLNGHANIYIRVATICSDGSTTDYTVLPLYRYTAPCIAPTNLSISNLASTSVTLHWTPGTTTQQEAVRYTKAGTSLSEVVTLPINTASYTITNLTPSTTYSWKVKGDCWSVTKSFTTSAQKLDDLDNTSSSKFSELNAYPNPASQILNLEINAGSGTGQNVTIQLISMLGQIYYSQDYSLQQGKNVVTINLSGAIANGIYVARIVSGNQTSESKVTIAR